MVAVSAPVGRGTELEETSGGERGRGTELEAAEEPKSPAG